MIAVAILGLGSIGLRHAYNLTILGAQVTGFDPDAERRALAEAEGFKTTTERGAALDGAAAVVIASPNRFHLEDLEAAAAADCHVLAEKPLAHTDEGLEDILGDFESRGLVVFAGFNLRLHPAIAAARQWLDEERLGTVLWARFQMSDYLPGWRPQQDYRLGYGADAVSGGVLFDMIHEFDLAAHLLGPAVVETAAARTSGLLEVACEDIADVVLRHQSDVHSSLHLDYVTRPRQRVAEIAGSGGRIDIDLDARRLVLTSVDGATREDIRFPATYADDYRAEAAAFVQCVAGDAVPACDGRQALSVLQNVLQARRLAGLPTS